MKFKEYIEEGFANVANSPTKTFTIDGIKVKVRAITRQANLIGYKVKFDDGEEIKIFNALKAEDAAKKAVEKKLKKDGE